MRVTFDVNSLRDYQVFLAAKQLPQYRFQGTTAIFPDEYAERLGRSIQRTATSDYEPLDGLFDFQRDIVRMAIRKQRFCVFADCGLGKTLIFLEFARHALTVLPADRSVLIVSPLMVVPQTVAECERFYGDDLRI